MFVENILSAFSLNRDSLGTCKLWVFVASLIGNCERSRCYERKRMYLQKEKETKKEKTLNIN
jgi:hypothetical protein